MLETSSQIELLAAALAAFHAECPSITKNTMNPLFSKKYADLSDITSIVNPVLAKNGLTVLQVPVGDEQLMTMLLHGSGQYIRSTANLHCMDSVIRRGKDGNDVRGVKPQDYGSALTYQRRYALSAILNLCIDDDDDGNRAQNAFRKQNTFAAPTEPVVPENAFDPKSNKQTAEPQKPVEKLTQEAIEKYSTDIDGATEQTIVKIEQEISQHGVKQSLPKEDWSVLAAKLLARWYDLAGNPKVLGTVTNRVVAYRGKGLLDEHQLKFLRDKLAERTAALKG
jgi:hypothetical protein